MFKLFRKLVKIYPFTYLGRLFTGHERTVRINKHVIIITILKGAGIIIGLLLVPLTIHYINPTQYGIWITLSSIISWLAYFDIGLGNGLRNKLAEALAVGDENLARIYISTTYMVMIIIIGGIYLLFLLINPMISWMKILNTSPELAGELTKLAFIVFTFFSLQLVLRLVINILFADQRPAWNTLVNVLSNFISLVIIYILTLTTHGSLIYLGATLSGVPIIVLLFISIYLFTGRYRKFIPSIKYVELKYFRDLIGLGARFFITQISTIIILSTDNIIITQLFGPAQVTPYNISFKYFSIITLSFITILLSPYWSAFTDAYTKGDIKWIRHETRKLVKIWSILTGVVILMIMVSNIVYHIWIGNIVHVPFILSIFMGIYVIIFTWNNIFVSFVNGTGKIQIRMYATIVAGILNIPLSIYFAKYLHMGIAGVIFATSICLLIDSVLNPIQYLKLVNKTAKGIWNK